MLQNAVNNLILPILGHLRTILRPSWGHPRTILGPIWSILVPSGGHLRAILDLVWAKWASRWVILAWSSSQGQRLAGPLVGHPSGPGVIIIVITIVIFISEEGDMVQDEENML